jgi:small-conductance mechanosensitive channel
MFGLSEGISSLPVQILLSLLFAGVASAAVEAIRRARSRFTDSENPILVDLVSSVLIISIVISMVLAIIDLWGQTETVLDQLGVISLDERAPEVAVSLAVLVAIQVLSGIARRLLNNVTAESSALDQHQREVTLRVGQITLWSLGLLFILGLWNVNLTGLLVGAGFLGIVIGMAARKTLGSLLGGFVLMFSRPFEVGDWVVIGDKQGIVSDITLMSTRLQNVDGEYIVVPNDVVSNKTITNRSRKGQYRLTAAVGIDYETDIDHAREVLLDAASDVAASHEFLCETPTPDVVVTQLGDSAVALDVYVWVDSPTARRVMSARDEFVAALRDACKANDITIPFPQRELSSRDGSDGVRFGEEKSEST